MSSYLLAIIVSEFKFIERYSRGGVRVRIWSRPEAVNMTTYALDASTEFLDFFENHLGIKYTLPKLEKDCCCMMKICILPSRNTEFYQSWRMK
ncbi:hypothetical protein COOONC_07980 [Cooperia oncophora]